MKTIVSDSSRRMVYHRSGCIYAMRIKSAHRMTLKTEEALRHGYHECSCCGGLKGFVRFYKRALDNAGRDIAFEYFYDERSDTLFIRTEIGFWKIFRKNGPGYVLCHCSNYDPAKKFEELMHAYFHRQCDVNVTDSILKMVHYIEEHDKAKKIMAVDYRNLPQRTKKQKKYYAKAKRRARVDQLRRLDRLFDSIKPAAEVS